MNKDIGSGIRIKVVYYSDASGRGKLRAEFIGSVKARLSSPYLPEVSREGNYRLAAWKLGKRYGVSVGDEVETDRGRLYEARLVGWAIPKEGEQ